MKVFVYTTTRGDALVAQLTEDTFFSVARWVDVGEYVAGSQLMNVGDDGAHAYLGDYIVKHPDRSVEVLTPAEFSMRFHPNNLRGMP